MSTFRTAPIDLGKGIAVEFTFADGRMDAIWSPRIPHGRRGRQILPAYRRARHEFLADVAERLGIVIAVADVGPDTTGVAA
jgi:hypothetical protein